MSVNPKQRKALEKELAALQERTLTLTLTLPLSPTLTLTLALSLALAPTLAPTLSPTLTLTLTLTLIQEAHGDGLEAVRVAEEQS